MAPPKKEASPAFQRPRRIELDYERSIDRLMDQWLNTPARADSLDDMLERLNDFLAMPMVLADRINRLAANMVTAVAHDNSRSWREAAAKATRSRQIFELLKADLASGPVRSLFQRYTAANSELIKTLPADIATTAHGFISEQKIAGLRAEDIAARLRTKLPEISAAKIQLLSRTGVASTATAITRSRAERLKLNWYMWLTSEDARVRLSHRKMDLVLVNWNDPPAPEQLIGIKSTLGHYHAGNCPYCRCDANVLVDLVQVSAWPCKVYTGGSIQRLSKAAFIKLSGMAA